MEMSSFWESRLYRFVIGRRRLLSSIAVGLVLLTLLPGWMREATRLLVAWMLQRSSMSA